MPVGSSSFIPVEELALDVEHADFDWLRGYLQREESKSCMVTGAASPVAAAANELGTESDSASTSELSFSPKRPSGAGTDSTPCSPTMHDKVFGSSMHEDSGTEPFTLVDSYLNKERASSLTHDDKRRRKLGWTSTEDLAILATVRRLGTQWPRIAAQLPGRTPDAVRNRWHRLQKTHSLCDTDEGRAALDALLLACGIDKNWAPSEVEPTIVCVKGSDHGRSMWTAEEDAMIEEGVRRFGCKWRQIAGLLQGRSDSSVRNRWMRLQKERANVRITSMGLSDIAPSDQCLDQCFATPIDMDTSSEQPIPLAMDASCKQHAEQSSSQSALGSGPLPNLAELHLAPPAPGTVRVTQAGSVAMPTLVPQPGAPAALASHAPLPNAASPPSTFKPAPFRSLKRRASSRRDVYAAQGEPIGFGSPMLGFDLLSFVEAVSGAITEEERKNELAQAEARAAEAASAAATAQDELHDVFVVDEKDSFGLRPSRVQLSRISSSCASTSTDAQSELSSQQLSSPLKDAEDKSVIVPRALRGVSAVFTGLGALSMASSAVLSQRAGI